MEEKIIQHLESMCDTPCEIKVVSTEAIEEALFIIFTFDDEKQAAVYYPQDDILFTPTDWQNGYPETIADIEDYEWIDSAGDMAVVMGGLPRAFSTIRDEQRKAFGVKIKNAREEKGLSQIELARLSGLKQANISRIEKGRYSVTLNTIARLSAVLGELI